jgi:hypothetical protein
MPYWLLSRTAIAPTQVNVSEEDPYLTWVSRLSATFQLVLTAGLIIAGVYMAYKWLVVKRK